jgi:predicted RNA-binding protein with PIN domain
MAVHVLVDGYNLIRQSDRLGEQDRLALELGRNDLLDRLRRYKRIRRHRITVVFDAAGKPGLSEERTQEKGIRVIYSGQGESADSVIRRMCRKEGGNLLVVTSDKQLSGYAEEYGATTMDSNGFEAKMEMALYLDYKGAQEEDEIEQQPVRGTRKKGPARRASKKERKRQRKWRKL